MGSGARDRNRMIFDVSHRTSYAYARPVLQSQHLVHLTPNRGARQTLLRHGLLIEPAPSTKTERADYFGNATAILTIDEQHSELVIHARSTVEVKAPIPPQPALSTPWDEVADRTLRRVGDLDIGVLQFASASRHTGFSRAAIDYALPSFAAGRPLLEAALDLTRRIHSDFVFDATATDIATPVSHVLAERRGVCQDFAHLALTSLRGLGLPARYVSGYLLTLPPPGQPRLKGADASHAWISVWDPLFAWVDFDPTNGMMPAGTHVTLAYGRDYGDVRPISGVLLGGGEQRMSVAVDVTLADSPGG